MIYVLCMITGGALVAAGFLLENIDRIRGLRTEKAIVRAEPAEPEPSSKPTERTVEDQLAEMLGYNPRTAREQGVNTK